MTNDVPDREAAFRPRDVCTQTVVEMGDDALDARRYRALRSLLEKSVGAAVEINESRLVYDEPEEGKRVSLQWYPDTPVGFYVLYGDTIDEVVDASLAHENANEVRARASAVDL